jgi:hypothetical protein
MPQGTTAIPVGVRAEVVVVVHPVVAVAVEAAVREAIR